MPKESLEFKQMPQRLSEEKIKQILKDYPEIKLDDGNQHFVIEKEDKEGNVKETHIPVWKQIPSQGGDSSKKIEEAIEEELEN